MMFIETTVFTRLVEKFLSLDEYLALQQYLLKAPESGSVIKGSGGLRKVRWKKRGRGKRGGFRVIYYWQVSQDQILMLYVYPKSMKDDLSQIQLNALREIVKKSYS